MEGASEEKPASVSNLVTVFENSRSLGAAPRAHGLESEHHRLECRPPSPAEPGEEPDMGEALGSGPRTVSRRYLSSLKNKLSSGAWRKSCQPETSPGPGMQFWRLAVQDEGAGRIGFWRGLSSQLVDGRFLTV
uniref:FYVE, RhoGEF and PH domain containing 2 n=1 Tax=Equus caballus TaxID=9796 RepID=A0A9L0RRG5_HORSE